MSSGESPVDRLVSFAGRGPQRPPRTTAVDLGLTAAAYVALLVAMLPLMRVVAPGAWTLGVLLLPVLVLATGALARRHRLPAVAVSLAEALVAVIAVMILFFGDTALFGVVPTPRSAAEVSELLTDAFDQIINGAAPLDAREGLTFLIVGGMLLLAIVVDHVVLTARMPLLATVALIAVWLIPSISVPSSVDVVAFVLLAATVLVLLRLETRARERDAAPSMAPPMAPPASTGFASAGIAAAATGIGAVAVVVTLVAAPLASGFVIRPGAGPAARWNSIDASLKLGDDLRRQSNSEVLRLQTTGAAPPYLRVATLSDFDGKDWQPDRGRIVPLESDEAYGDFQPNADVRIVETTTTIQIVNLVSASAPVSYPAVDVEGLDGEWGSAPFNGTVLSRTSSVSGQDYEVVARSPRPTLEQIRATRASPRGGLEATTALPAGLPASIFDLAHEVTAGTTTDYDALLTLQRWFRSGEFEYSLDAPVEEGFDGSGADAIARFLEVRKGYCIHFAAAFALMARTLGMPSRIVVGFLPGSSRSDPLMGDREYSVMASQLHAWPEVAFAGIGWIPFEPTNSLGTPTSFSPAVVDVDPLNPGAENGETPLPTASPTASLRPEGIEERGPDSASSANPAIRALPWLGSVILVLAVLAIPAAIRMVRRRDLAAAARAGDAGGAWRSLQEEAIDLGIPVLPDESPRVFGARLVARHGAPLEATRILVERIEHASYARGGHRRGGDDLAEPVTEVCSALAAHAGRRRRALAFAVPRSLLIKPGSVYAGDGAKKRR